MSRKGIEISGLVSTHYEIGPTSIDAGQIVWIPSLYPNKDRLVLNIDVSADPTEEHLSATVSPLPQPRIHIPVKSLELASDEFYFAVKGKMRPAIVLAGGFNRWPTNAAEQLFLCVPLYSVDKPKISQKFVVEAQALKYSGLFYLPPSAEFHISECIARFCLIQVTHGTAIELHKVGKDPVMLSDEFFGWMRTHLIQYLGAELPRDQSDNLAAYSELVIEEARLQGAY